MRYFERLVARAREGAPSPSAGANGVDSAPRPRGDGPADLVEVHETVEVGGRGAEPAPTRVRPGDPPTEPGTPAPGSAERGPAAPRSPAVHGDPDPAAARPPAPARDADEAVPSSPPEATAEARGDEAPPPVLARDDALRLAWRWVSEGPSAAEPAPSAEGPVTPARPARPSLSSVEPGPSTSPEPSPARTAPERPEPLPAREPEPAVEEPDDPLPSPRTRQATRPLPEVLLDESPAPPAEEVVEVSIGTISVRVEGPSAAPSPSAPAPPARVVAPPPAPVRRGSGSRLSRHYLRP